MFKKTLLSISIIFILLIQGCATGGKTGAMISELSEETLISSESTLFNALEIGVVSGGKATNPAWASNVSNENFTEALESSLKLHSMFNSENSSYVVNADLKKLKQPFVGFDMKVTAYTDYELIEKESEKVVFSSEIITPYIATVGDAVLGVKRLRLANEGAIKANITEFIKQLVHYFSEPPLPESED